MADLETLLKKADIATKTAELARKTAEEEAVRGAGRVAEADRKAEELKKKAEDLQLKLDAEKDLVAKALGSAARLEKAFAEVGGIFVEVRFQV